ncbi:hypothetical protein Tco_1262499 [Tanacetum coccineum]
MMMENKRCGELMIENHRMDKLLKEVLMVDELSIVETDKVQRIENEEKRWQVRGGGLGPIKMVTPWWHKRGVSQTWYCSSQYEVASDDLRDALSVIFGLSELKVSS